MHGPELITPCPPPLRGLGSEPLLQPKGRGGRGRAAPSQELRVPLQGRAVRVCTVLSLVGCFFGGLGALATLKGSSDPGHRLGKARATEGVARAGFLGSLGSGLGRYFGLD